MDFTKALLGAMTIVTVRIIIVLVIVVFGIYKLFF